MYSLGMPVSAIRTKIRQEFEKHRYVSQLSVVDVLLYQSHAEFQVSSVHLFCLGLHDVSLSTCGSFKRTIARSKCCFFFVSIGLPIVAATHNSRIKY